MNNSFYSEHVIDWLYEVWINEQDDDALLGAEYDPPFEIPDVARDD